MLPFAKVRRLVSVEDANCNVSMPCGATTIRRYKNNRPATLEVIAGTTAVEVINGGDPIASTLENDLLHLQNVRWLERGQDINRASGS